MKHRKENILIYISLGLSILIIIYDFLIDSDGFIEEIKTSPTSNIAWNILLFILMYIVLAFCIYVLIFITYIIYAVFRQIFTEYKRSNAKADDSVFAAIRLNDIRAVENHISRGLNVNTVTEDGSSPLHRAIQGVTNSESNCDNLEIIELLIKKGSDVNGKNQDGCAPLHLGTTHEEVIELLISKGADVNAKDDSGSTLLHEIIFCEDENLINLIISKGADVNSINEDGETPLDRLSSEELEGVTAEIAVLIRKQGGKTGEELKAEGK